MRLRVRGIFSGEKLLFQLIEMLEGNERNEREEREIHLRFVTPQSISKYGASVLLRPVQIYFS